MGAPSGPFALLVSLTAQGAATLVAMASATAVLIETQPCEACEQEVGLVLLPRAEEWVYDGGGWAAEALW